jgi:hypothetical protein
VTFNLFSQGTCETLQIFINGQMEIKVADRKGSEV